jgi:hypothetical protein
MALCDTQRKVMLITEVISCGLVMGCVSSSDLFKKFYKPAETDEGASVQPIGSSPPQLVYSRNPVVDCKRLRDVGYVLIGATSFDGAPDLYNVDRAASSQGQNFGAAIVLLKIRPGGEDPRYIVVHVVRITENGVALEWEDHAPQAIKRILQRWGCDTRLYSPWRWRRDFCS